MCSSGFGKRQDPSRSIRVWLSLYGKGNEDEPVGLERMTLQLVPGQSVEMAAVRAARELLKNRRRVHEVIVHRGPSAVPARGADVLTRVCREPFRLSRIMA